MAREILRGLPVVFVVILIESRFLHHHMVFFLRFAFDRDTCSRIVTDAGPDRRSPAVIPNRNNRLLPDRHPVTPTMPSAWEAHGTMDAFPQCREVHYVPGILPQ